MQRRDTQRQGPANMAAHLRHSSLLLLARNLKGKCESLEGQSYSPVILCADLGKLTGAVSISFTAASCGFRNSLHPWLGSPLSVVTCHLEYSYKDLWATPLGLNQEPAASKASKFTLDSFFLRIHHRHHLPCIHSRCLSQTSKEASPPLLPNINPVGREAGETLSSTPPGCVHC